MNANAAADLFDTPVLYPNPRNDLYGPVHRGLRFALNSALARIGATDVGDCTRLATMIDDVDGVLYLCASHLAHENTFIHTAVERRRPGWIARFAEAHHGHEHEIAEIRALTLAFGQANVDRQALLRTLYLRFSHFVAENLAHMIEEETLVGPLLESLYSHDELAALEGELLSSIGPEEMLAFMRVMIPANPQTVRVAMLAGARPTMPREAFVATVQIFRSHLDRDEWIDLATRLDVPA